MLGTSVNRVIVNLFLAAFLVGIFIWKVYQVVVDGVV